MTDTSVRSHWLWLFVLHGTAEVIACGGQASWSGTKEDMAVRDFAKAFYLSKEWRRARAYVFNRDAGLCVRCGALGEIVHHKEHLTPQNISNPEIALGEDNLELLCRNCHALAHAGELATDSGLAFDDEGNIIKREFLS